MISWAVCISEERRTCPPLPPGWTLSSRSCRAAAAIRRAAIPISRRPHRKLPVSCRVYWSPPAPSAGRATRRSSPLWAMTGNVRIMWRPSRMQRPARCSSPATISIPAPAAEIPTRTIPAPGPRRMIMVTAAFPSWWCVCSPSWVHWPGSSFPASSSCLISCSPAWIKSSPGSMS